MIIVKEDLQEIEECIYKYHLVVTNKENDKIELSRYYKDDKLELAENQFLEIGNSANFVNGKYYIVLYDMELNAKLKQYDTEFDI